VAALAITINACSTARPRSAPVPVPPSLAPSGATSVAPSLAPSVAVKVAVTASQKVCQLTGEDDKQFQPPRPTLNQTVSRYGLTGTDNGYSFEHDGKAWFLFGDSPPSQRFHGQPNADTDPPRNPLDNDSIAFTTAATASTCVPLSFVPDSIGAYGNPSVATSAGESPVTLRTNETPIAGISEAGRMYVVFGTDNLASNPPGRPPAPNGGPTRSVVTVGDGTNLGFKYLYDLSGGARAKFIFVAIQPDNDGFLYFWGAGGGTADYRHSSVYLARKKADTIGQPGGFEYLTGVDRGGHPIFGNAESAAAPLFTDRPDPCVGELSVQWNQYLQRWVLLYNCADDTPGHPRGIYMRFATQPWGPWSPPTTIFSTKQGLCLFIHRSVNAGHPACDQLATPNRLDVQGGDYSPGIISRFTTGRASSPTSPAVSTFYYTMSTWNPYQIVLMTATVQLTG
jgi:hypothetical protein